MGGEVNLSHIMMMLVTFVLEDESTFCMEVGFFDSFQEIKEKIKKHKGITVDRQTLKFEGKVLDDEESIFNTNISEASLVELIVTPPAVSRPENIDENVDDLQWILDMPTPNIEEFLSWAAPQSPITVSENTLPPPPQPPTRIQFTVKILERRKRPFSIEMNLDDTVQQLKEKIYYNPTQRVSFSVEEMEVRIKSGEELDHTRSLRDCGMLSISHVYVRKRVPTTTSPVTDMHFGKMVTVMVIPNDGTQKIMIEVNGRCCVEDLRFELEKFHRHALPENGLYYFTNKSGNVMTETYAFDWFGMEDGDTVQITPIKK